MDSSLDPVINSVFHNLGEIDLRILQYISAHQHDIESESASALAQRCHVSAASITRMAQKLGFSGYTDLRYFLRREHAHASQKMTARSDLSDAVMTLQDDMQQSIKLFVGTADREALYEMMDSARRFYAFGTGYGQRLMIEDFCRCMQSLGRDVTVIPATGELQIAKRYMSPEDLLLIVSLSGSIAEYRDAFQTIGVINTPVISITNLGNNELASFTDYNFYYQNSSFIEDTNMSSTSYITLHIILHLLFEGYKAWCALSRT